MHARDERGSVLPIALILMMLCLAMGATILNTVDVQQRAAKRTNQRESSLQIAEGVLETQAFELSSNWSQSAGSPFATCTSAAVQTAYCPSHDSLTATYPTTDYTGATWTSDVFDNSSTEGGNAMQSFFSNALAAQAPRYDANGDNQMWVRATATFHGKTRRLIALVKRQLNPAESFPFNTITAGHMATSNNGNKLIVNLTSTNGGSIGPVRLRCADLNSSACIDARTGQISPAGQIFAGYNGGNAMNPAALGRLRATAKADGTYYTGCPANPAGRVVFVESGNCSYNNSSGSVFNSAAAPGMFIVNDGSIAFNGNSVFYGVIYAVNKSNSSNMLVTIGGTAQLVGAIAVDGNGGVQSGDSADNIRFDANAAANIRSYGTTGVVQNTWRELG